MAREASARLEEIASTLVALKSRAGRRHDQLRYHRGIKTATPRVRDVGGGADADAEATRSCFELLKDLTYIYIYI